MNMKKILIILFTSTLFLFNGAWALDLGEAKSKGLVGETPRGYLEAVKSPNDATKQLLKDINGRRNVQYKKISKSNGTSVKAVESVAGEKAMSLTKKGHFVKVGGKWVKKN
jgi:uncharacterized protein YdbL (DUF1318 family)